MCVKLPYHPLPPESVPVMNVSYKPQKISPKSSGTVRQLLHNKIRDSYVHPQFVSDVIKPLQVDYIMDQEVLNLSGGELQRVALTMALGKVWHTSETVAPMYVMTSLSSLLMCILLMNLLLISTLNSV